MLRVSGLSVQYRSQVAPAPAVDCVSFSLAAAEAVGLLGESGCGKTTLARALLRLLPPEAQVCGGAIHFREHDVLALNPEQLRQLRGAAIALIAQDPAQALNPVLSVGDQVAEVLRSHTSLARAERKHRVLETLSEVGFADTRAVYGRYPHQLSGGERQRAAIAQAVVCRPALLIADEPTTKLDARLQSELLALFADLRQRHEMALLLISHDPAILAANTERLLVMYGGEIVESAATAELLRNPLHPYTQALLRLAHERSWMHGDAGSPAARGRFSAIAGEAPHSSLSGCRFEPRCSQRMPHCAEKPPATTQHAGHQLRCFKYE